MQDITKSCDMYLSYYSTFSLNLTHFVVFGFKHTLHFVVLIIFIDFNTTEMDPTELIMVEVLSPILHLIFVMIRLCLNNMLFELLFP